MVIRLGNHTRQYTHTHTHAQMPPITYIIMQERVEVKTHDSITIRHIVVGGYNQ